MFVAAAQTQTLNDETRVLLDHIDDSVRSMGHLFGGLLDISRLDAGVVEAHVVPFSIRSLVQNVVRELQPQATAKNLELRVRVAEQAVRSDPLLIERVLRNLVSNALAYTTRGGILIGSTNTASRSPVVSATVMPASQSLAWST
jgi:signal transduction histidine kinase